MLVNTPKKGDLIYKAFGLKIETYIVVDTRNDIDSSILMLDLNAEKGSDTYRLAELFKDGKTDTKEYRDLMDGYNNLYTGFYGKYGIRLHSQYFFKLKEVREQIKLNKVFYKLRSNVLNVGIKRMLIYRLRRLSVSSSCSVSLVTLPR